MAAAGAGAIHMLRESPRGEDCTSDCRMDCGTGLTGAVVSVALASSSLACWLDALTATLARFARMTSRMDMGGMAVAGPSMAMAADPGG